MRLAVQTARAMRLSAVHTQAARFLVLTMLCALPACDACTPMGWWWSEEEGLRNDMGEQVDVDVDGEGEGEGGEGEGESPVGEGEGEGEGEAVGEGEGEAVGEGESEAVGEGEGEGESSATNNVWLEIDYSGAFTSSSPGWEFSATPGFPSSAWAMEGDSFPEAWDRFNNMEVVDDPIGRSLELDGELQLMVGLPSSVTYERVLVRLEGRSRATSSSATFDVFNPLTGCGISGATMSNDWDPDVVEVDLADCLVPGEGVQAVRVDPTNGVLALIRMRVILVNAQY